MRYLRVGQKYAFRGIPGSPVDYSADDEYREITIGDITVTGIVNLRINMPRAQSRYPHHDPSEYIPESIEAERAEFLIRMGIWQLVPEEGEVSNLIVGLVVYHRFLPDDKGLCTYKIGEPGHKPRRCGLPAVNHYHAAMENK